MRLSRLMIWLWALSTVSAPCAIAQNADSNWGLPDLMHSLAQVHTASARFTERETLKMLNAPFISTGTLTYTAPDYVQKTTQTPNPQNFVLDHGQITISGGADQQPQVFSLNADARISGLIEGIRATLSGDLPTLERIYIIKLTGTETGWQLTLQPKDAELQHFIKWMFILGHKNLIDAIDTVSGNGDHSEMGISENINDVR